jgi:hypothetical protein
MTAIARRLAWSPGAGQMLARGVATLRQVAALSRRLLCGLSGHEMVRYFEPDRLSLRCVSCGAQTPGWTIDVNPAFRRRTGPRAMPGPRRHLGPSRTRRDEANLRIAS